MKRLVIGLLSCICLFSANMILAQDYYVYVTSESEDEVALITFDGEKADVAEKITVGRIPTEIEGPHGITVGPEGKYWYLSMAHGIPFGKLYKFSTTDNQLIGETELGLFPATMQISKATGLLYVVNFNLHGKMEPSSVSVVDPEIMAELTKITTGAMPHGSRISSDGLHHYSVAMMSGELFEINTVDLEVNRKLMLDQMGEDHHMAHGGNSAMASHSEMMHSTVKPTWVIPHPNQKKLYIAGNGVHEVLEVDIEKWEISDRLTTGKGPYNVEITPDGEKMVVTYKSDAQTGIWDLKTKKELAKIENTRKVSHGIAISSDSKYAFVSVEGIGAEPGAVDVIDLESYQKVASVDVGKQAGGIAFWKIEE